jgi:hypothetical protein
MLSSISNYQIAIFVVLVSFALGRLFYYFKFKRINELTEFDKALWHLKFTCLFFAVLVLVSVFFLPVNYYEIVDTKTSSPNVIVQQLVRNQERMAQDMRHSRDILYCFGFLAAFLLLEFFSFLGKAQSARRKPKGVSKPLGL